MQSATAIEPPAATPRRVAYEVGVSFAVLCVVGATMARIAWLSEYYAVIIAALLLYLPSWMRIDSVHCGAVMRPIGRHVAIALLMAILVLPPFTIGFVGWTEWVCSQPLLRPLAAGCRGGSLWAQAHFRLPNEFVALCGYHLLVAALPEEFYFRGFVQGRLAEWLRSPSAAIVLASALFALCHWIVQGNPATLAVFFPGLLFGLLRARTGSILPGTLFHALCNIYIETLQRSLFG